MEEKKTSVNEELTNVLPDIKNIKSSENYTLPSKGLCYTEEENNIVVEYNTTSNNEKFTLWRVDDVYYILSTQAEDDKDLTNLSSLYIKSIYWHKGK